tara:strand:- start:218 stop:805 length:588 start_codon:yes stop_codon:yes gene_type:complete
MIRIILVTQIFLFSCSSIDLGYIEVFQESFRKNEIKDLKSFYDSDFSFIRLSQGRNQAVFVLSNYDDGIETWTGASGEEVITYLGLILSSKNLDRNIKMHNVNNIPKNLNESFSSLLSFDNPEAVYLDSSFNIQNYPKDINNKRCNGDFKIIKRGIHSIRYEDEIFICYENKTTKFSIQKVNPFDKEIKIEFFYQ